MPMPALLPRMVEAAELGDGPRDDGPACRLVGEVGSARRSLDADRRKFFDGSGALLLIATNNHEFGAGLR